VVIRHVMACHQKMSRPIMRWGTVTLRVPIARSTVRAVAFGGDLEAGVTAADDHRWAGR